MIQSTTTSAKILLRKDSFEIPSGITIRAAMERLQIQPKSVIPTQNGELVPEDQILKDGDVIRLVPVISGG